MISASQRRILTGSCEGDIQDSKRPVIATASEVTYTHQIKSHRHPRGQLLYSDTGGLIVHCQRQHWYFNASQAVWIPPFHVHEIEAPGAVVYRCLFVDEPFCPQLPDNVTILELTPLLRELVREAGNHRECYRIDSAEHRLAGVIHDQLLRLTKAQFPLPMPTDRRLSAIISSWIKNPEEDRSRAQWSEVVGASERTLARLFRLQTGYSFQQWRQCYLVHLAKEKLQQGSPVTTVALQLGYQSTSAFTVMFKRFTGKTPSSIRPNRNTN